VHLEGRQRQARIRHLQPHGAVLLVGFEGIESLNDLEPWIGSLLEVDRTELPQASEGEIYQFEALGLAVETTAGEPIGVVVEVLGLGANDVWVVRLSGARAGREALIPVVGAIVREIDLARRVATIEPIAGLLDG
jgi:16S rRNA processing protein RimM